MFVCVGSFLGIIFWHQEESKQSEEVRFLLSVGMLVAGGFMLYLKWVSKYGGNFHAQQCHRIPCSDASCCCDHLPFYVLMRDCGNVRPEMQRSRSTSMVLSA